MIRLVAAALPALAVLLLPVPGLAQDQILDDFSTGLSASHWAVLTNQPLFSLDDSGGDVLISKPTGGSGGLDSMSVELTRPVLGDFDLSIHFSEASLDRVSGSPGNQLQLNLRIGSQLFVVVRSDEDGVGHNAHVWVDPPGQWEGPILTSATSGLLRITRIGGTVTGYFDQTLLFQGTYGTARVAGVSFLLQNNGTTDAISARFDDFSLTADEIGIFVDGFEHGNAVLWSGATPTRSP